MTAITTPPSRLWALICNVRRVPLGDGVTPSDMFPPESRTLCADLTARFCTHKSVPHSRGWREARRARSGSRKARATGALRQRTTGKGHGGRRGLDATILSTVREQRCFSCGVKRPRRMKAPVSAQTFFERNVGLYKEGRLMPAMAINGRRNKPFGPGGSTRRLHHQRTDDG